MTVLEAIGYLASILVAASLMMSSILRLRLLNLLGAGVFTIYGFLIRAYPVAAVNLFIVLIDAYYLLQIFTQKEYFRLLQVQPESQYLSFFLNFYEKEIRKFQPEFFENLPGDYLAFFVLRDLVPAGLVLVEPQATGRLLVRLDFVIPGYRDFKIGKFVYRKHKRVFRELGVQRLYAEPGNSRHQAYLRRMGFTPERLPSGQNVYCLHL